MAENTRVHAPLRSSSANKGVTAVAPATNANIGVGFDILGFAYADPNDTVIAAWSDTPGIHIADIRGDGGKLPREAGRNTAGIAAMSVLKTAIAHGAANANTGVALTIEKGLPLASGMGSSAASAVAAAVATNVLLGEPLSRSELLSACLDGEEVVSGRHADNVAPSLFGGLILAYGVEAEQILQLPIPPTLHLARVTPDVEVPTLLARAALPKEISLKQMVAQTASVARLVDAIYRADVQAMAAAMEGDGVVEPARAHLMPFLADIRAAAKRAGALGLVISGAGPTLCAVCDDPQVAQRVASAMHAAYAERGMSSVAAATTVSRQGARIL